VDHRPPRRLRRRCRMVALGEAVLYAVRMDVAMPSDLVPADRADLLARERAYSQELQRSGKWLYIWRVGRTTRTYLFRGRIRCAGRTQPSRTRPSSAGPARDRPLDVVTSDVARGRATTASRGITGATSHGRHVDAHRRVVGQHRSGFDSCWLHWSGYESSNRRWSLSRSSRS
jgi:hypothetical protein